MIDLLKARDPQFGNSPWDYYGLESEDDLHQLGDLLAGIRDRSGKPACFTANFVMANPDLDATKADYYRQIHWKPIVEGFPGPYSERLLPAYRRNIDRGVFYPGLHGASHFNPYEFLRALNDQTEYGTRVRRLVDHGVSYSATQAPEYNFALVSRHGSEVFLAEPLQREWIERGIDLFSVAFGFRPRTTCAPGYRANAVTSRLWAEAQIDCVQGFGRDPLVRRAGLLLLSRNVTFEPVFSEGDCVGKAVAEAKQAVSRGEPIIICSHSISYISRYLERAASSRVLLEDLLKTLLREFPDLRFASDADVADAYGRSDWFRSATASEIAGRSLRFARTTLGH